MGHGEYNVDFGSRETGSWASGEWRLATKKERAIRVRGISNGVASGTAVGARGTPGYLDSLETGVLVGHRHVPENKLGSLDCIAAAAQLKNNGRRRSPPGWGQSPIAI